MNFSIIWQWLFTISHQKTFTKMTKPIITALAAYGMSGLVFHGPLLLANSGFEIKKILERTKNISKDKHPAAEIVRDFEAILYDEEIELVIINTPDYLHFDMVKQAIGKGKHVVVEKPITLKTEEANELISLAKAKGIILSVFQNRRWDGDYLTVKKVVEGKMLGRLVEFESHYDRYRNFIQEGTWKEESGAGTGVLYNLGSHMIDQVVDLFGMPKAITADLRIQRTGGKVTDAYDLRLDYPELKVVLKCSYLAREPGPRYQLHGTEGSFTKYGIDPQEEMLKAGFLPIGNDWGTEPEQDWGFINTSINGLHVDGTVETEAGCYGEYYKNIYEAIREGAELKVKPEQSRDVIKLIELAIESDNLKKTINI
ncbi:Gfo/Idh/MocA family oxidoreductase [Flammeovirgaceae bacterium SG7u.111]|nr:Gfo/Idh/MocA family oxidoreductase [Flammeovirgaceae bacterium SG7u.132]WPO35746.1 Gfo/Idh/MocA family oxidoreductase [Flammeovirgaceae bacterium SG7u.111]